MKSKHKGLIASGKMSGAEEKKPKLSLEDMAGMLSNEDEDGITTSSEPDLEEESKLKEAHLEGMKDEHAEWEGSPEEEELETPEEEEDENMMDYPTHKPKGHLYGGHKMPHITVVIQHGDDKKVMKR